MIQEWSVALPAFLVATAAFLLPGLIVLTAGWGASRVSVFFLAPAVSTAILAVSATLAPLVGLSWSALPVAVLTIVAAVVALLLRRWVGPEDLSRPGSLDVLLPLGAFLAAAAIVSAQLIWTFGRPENISQTFDAIVHLNTVAYAVDTTNASAFHIGATSDIPFYPNAWHSVAALAAVTTGAPVPVAVSAANIAIGAIAWPSSCVALAGAFFRGRTVALVSAAALSTGFGAFPMLLFFFGVLYPNAMAYAILPAGVAVVVWLLQATKASERVRWGVLLAVLCAGIGLGHPNAFLALFAFGAVIAVSVLLTEALRAGDRRTWISNGAIVTALLVFGVGLWRFSRTNYEMSRWGPWQSTAQSAGEALLLSPRAYPITLVVSALVIIGIVAIIRKPRLHLVALPYVVASFMFVLVSGTGVNNVLREMVTNPWYNDAYRLAALLPIAGIPVATLGAVVVADAGRELLARRSTPRLIVVAAGTVAALAVFSVGAGPNVLRTAADTRTAYAVTSASPLLTVEEEQLLSRLDETTPPDALIAGSPWTGTSLAYAVGEREVVEKHVFGSRTPDEIYLDERLRDIDVDPRVCEAVNALGVDYVLDFGSQNVWGNPAASVDRRGIEALPESSAFELVDSEGADAKLYRIVGC